VRKVRNYILNEKGEVVPEPDIVKWGMWFETHTQDRIVKQEWVENVRISTVFLGLDHRWGPIGPPILWETMTFSNRKDWDNEMSRCSGNREQAEAMHEEMVERVKERNRHRPGFTLLCL
jgi:hypothetical protein